MTDAQIILTADRLLADGHITPEERQLLVTEDERIVNESHFPALVYSDGCVLVRRKGHIPYMLRGYAT